MKPRRPFVAYAAGAFVVWCIASTVFVVHRNGEHRRRELARAGDAAAAIARGEEPLAAIVAAGVVAPAEASARYPFLRRRTLLPVGGAAPSPGAAGARPLGGPRATPEDKILADAATAAEHGGPFTRILADGSDRILAARPAPGGVAVVLCRPLEPAEPYPFLVIFGLLGAGVLIVAATGRIGPRAQTAGLAAALAVLAVPAAAWGGATASALIVLAATLFALADHRGTAAAAAAALRRNRVAYTYLLPAAAGMAVLVLVPFIAGTTLGFYDHAQGEWRWVGFENFRSILSGDGRSFTDPLNFWFTLGVTLLWTAVNVALHVTIGVVLALALRERWMRARGLFRVLFILPWAIPNYITALIWHGMFQKQFGAVNALLDAAGIDGVSWFSGFATSFCANVVTNTWLGFPFMMVVALGALESIPRDLYEAASVDGAGRWQRFVQITLPNLKPALMPAVILGSVWTFNMFNVIYLVSGGEPAGATEILVTRAYRWAFERGSYGMAAAYATIIFLILVGWTLLGSRLSREKEAT